MIGWVRGGKDSIAERKGCQGSLDLRGDGNKAEGSLLAAGGPARGHWK